MPTGSCLAILAKLTMAGEGADAHHAVRGGSRPPAAQGGLGQEDVWRQVPVPPFRRYAPWLLRWQVGTNYLAYRWLKQALRSTP